MTYLYLFNTVLFGFNVCAFVVLLWRFWKRMGWRERVFVPAFLTLSAAMTYISAYQLIYL